MSASAFRRQFELRGAIVLFGGPGGVNEWKGYAPCPCLLRVRLPRRFSLSPPVHDVLRFPKESSAR